MKTVAQRISLDNGYPAIYEGQENVVTKPFYRKKLFYGFLLVLLVGGIVVAVLFGTHTLPPMAVSSIILFI